MAQSSNKQLSELPNLATTSTYEAGIAQATAYRLLKKFTESAVKAYGITMTQWFIIGTIYDAGKMGISVTQLSRIVDTNLPHITNTLNILEAKQIILRTTHTVDTRSKLITINPNFNPTIAVIEKDLRVKMRTTIYSSISPAELLQYVKVLHKLNHSLSQK